MSEIAAYVVSVVVIPACVAAVLALPFAVRPLRSRRVLAEAGIAFALMAAFAVSFTNDLGWNAILRQIVTIPNDDAPFERWHRVGMAAIVLGAASWAIAFARAGGPRVRVAVGIGAALLAAAGAGFLVRFPGSSVDSQATLAILVVASIVGFGGFGRRVMLWSSWLAFGVLAFLMGESGFAYLAVMCGAVSAASFLIGALLWLGARGKADAKSDAKSGAKSDAKSDAKGGAGSSPEGIGAAPDAAPRGVAVPIALGTLASVVACCGQAYDARDIPPFFWFGAVLLPYMVLLADIFVRPSIVRRRVLLAFIAIFLGAGALVGLYAAWSAQDAVVVPSSDRQLLDMYGG